MKHSPLARSSFAVRLTLAEALEGRRLLAGQIFAGEGPTVGVSSQAVTLADLNRDGRVDLVAGGASSVTVAFGDGAGGFGPAASVSVGGSGVRAVAVVDLNADGLADLVTANSTGNTVSVLNGRGDGTFNTAVTYGTGAASPVGLAVGDFDRDGRTDVAAACSTGNAVAILRNTGTGLVAAGTVADSGSPLSIVAADFDNDGFVDLATANSTGNGVTVLMNNRAGGFGALPLLPTGTAARSLATTDFNGDGIADLAVANATSKTVSLLQGQGNGTFTIANAVPLTTTPYAVAAGDFNGDGRPDVAVGSFGVGGNLSVLGNNGNFSFNVSAVPATRPIFALAAANLDGDSRPDIAAVSYQSASNVSVLIGNPAGGFVTPLVASAGTTTGTAYGVSADFNGDGLADLATANYPAGTVSVAIGNGDGTFTASGVYTVGTNPVDLITADFNGDGRPDLATANYGPTSTASGTSGSTTTGNGTTVTVLSNTASGQFVTSTVTTARGPVALTAGDFNRDGRDDLVVLTQDNGVTLQLSNGDGSFRYGSGFTGGSGVAAATVLDFDRNGTLDLAVVNNTTNNVSLYPGYGNGGFGTAINVAVGVDPGRIVAADFNKDGQTDLATANYSGNTVSVIYNTFGSGPTPFYISTTPVVGSPNALAAGDFDGDGLTDLGVATTLGNVTVLKNLNTYGTAVVSTGVATADSLNSLTAADFNGDSRPDLLAPSYSANTLTVLLNRGPFALPNVSVANGVLTIGGNYAADTLTEAGGTLTLTTPDGTLKFASAVISGLFVNGPTLTVATDLGRARAGAFDVNVFSGNVTFNSTQHLRTLTVNGSAALAAGRNKVLRVTGLSVSARGMLDLNDNSLILDYATATGQTAAVRNLIASARSNGTWKGVGLTSSAARTTANTTLGYMEASEYQSIYGTGATFAGETIDSTAVLVRYTTSGDSNFDGKTDFNDFLRLQNAFGRTNTTTAGGDFNLDGRTDFNDFLALQNAFGTSLPPAPATAVKTPIKTTVVTKR